jgi:hypothetical protein
VRTLELPPGASLEAEAAVAPLVLLLDMAGTVPPRRLLRSGTTAAAEPRPAAPAAAANGGSRS